MRQRVLGLLLSGLVGAGTLAVVTPGAAQTNGFVLHCLSARSSGAGCLTMAREGVPTNLFRDPAGLTSLPGTLLEVNAAPFTPTLKFQNSENAQTDGSVHAYPMASAAFARRLGRRAAWAVGMEPIGGFGSDFMLNHALLGQKSYKTFFAAAKVGPALAYELAPGLSVGASGYLVYGQIRDFRMPFSMPPSAAQGMGGLVQLDPAHYPALFSNFTELTAYGDSKGFSGTAFGASLGVSYAPTPALRVAASWSPKTTLTMDGATVKMDLGPQFEQLFGALVAERMANHAETQQEAMATVGQMLGQAGLDLSRPDATLGNYAGGADLSLPQTAMVGASYRLGEGWTLGTEAVWMQWSKADDTMPFRMTGGDNPNLNLLINADPANGDFTYPFPLSWQDTWTGKVGLEKQLASGHALRAGYLFGQNPVPDHAVFIAFPAVSEQAATAGATLQMGRFPLDLSLVYAFTKEIRGAASGHLIGAEYQNSITRMNEMVVTVGTTLRF